MGNFVARGLRTSWWRWREGRDRIVSKLCKDEGGRERKKDLDCIRFHIHFQAMQT